HPERPALVFPDAELSYAELLDDTIKMARGLAALDLSPGSHIGLFLPNGTEFVKAFFAISMLGHVAVPLNTRHKATELSYIVANADLVAIFTSDEGSDYVDLPTILRDALPGLAESPAGKPLSLPKLPRLRHLIQLTGTPRAPLLGRDDFLAAGRNIPDERIEDARRRVCVRD